jgi:predicted dehydrogenase
MSRWVVECATGQAPQITTMDVQGSRSQTGVDKRVNAQLVFSTSGGQITAPITAQFTCGFDGMADNSLRIYGQRGSIIVPSTFWQANEATLMQSQSIGFAPPSVHHERRPLEINGFEYEIREAMACIRAGAIESAVISHAETLASLQTMDAMRAKLGVKYPFEN